MAALRNAIAVAALAAGLLAAPALLGRAGAHAQEAEPQESVSREAAGDDLRPEGRGEEGHGHEDPSKHFNFVGGPMSHSKKDIVGGPFGDGKNFNPATGESVPGEEEPMSAPFIFMIINFVLLLAILAKWGGPAARKVASERHDQIKTALDEASKLRKQAADKLAEYESRLKAADAEIAKLVEGMRADAEADKKRILELAERQAAQMKHEAELHIAAEIELARASLTREVTAAATAAAEKILRDKVTPADQQKLVGAFIGELQGATQKEAR